MNAEEMIENVLSRAEGERLERRPARTTPSKRLGSSGCGRRSIGFWTTGSGSSILPIWPARTVAFVARNRRRPLHAARARADPPSVSLG